MKEYKSNILKELETSIFIAEQKLHDLEEKAKTPARLWYKFHSEICEVIKKCRIEDKSYLEKTEDLILTLRVVLNKYELEAKQLRLSGNSMFEE